MINFVNNELTGSEFDNQFCTLYIRTEEESQQVFTDMEKIKSLELDQPPKSFRDELQDIYLDLDNFFDVQELNSRQEIPPYYRTTEQIRQLVQEVIQEFKAYK